MMADEKIDGRRLRSVRTRAAIVEALLSLLEEGELKPTAPQIAERAEVSLRTVFQHFAEVEVLFAAVSERQIERIARDYVLIDPDLPLAERVDAFVHQRCKALELVTPVARAAHLKEPFAPAVHAEIQKLRDLNREELGTTFARELDALDPADKSVLLPGMEALAGWRMWESLRADTGLGVDEATAVVRYQLRALLLAAGFDAAA